MLRRKRLHAIQRRRAGSRSAARPRACRRCRRSRSAGGTKSGEPSFVTFATKSTTAFFGAGPFHEGRLTCLALPKHLRRGAEVSELVDRHSVGPKGEDLVRLRLHSLRKIFLGHARRDVGYIVFPAGRNEVLDPTNGRGVDLGAYESRGGPTQKRTITRGELLGHFSGSC
jgi:hypothetical protein